MNLDRRVEKHQESRRELFREEKATAVAAYFLCKAPDSMLNDLTLMKLMVIAERLCMAQSTSLITGARFVSMQNGPALSEVLDLMRGEKSAGIWNHHIQSAAYEGGNYCVLKVCLDVTEFLSEFESDLLTSVWNEHGCHQNWQIVELTSAFPEWELNCAFNKSSKPISLESILELGFHESHLRAKERAEEIEYFELVSA